MVVAVCVLRVRVCVRVLCVLVLMVLLLLLLLLQADANTDAHIDTDTDTDANANAHVGRCDKIEEVRLREILGTKGFTYIHASRCGHILGADHWLCVDFQCEKLCSMLD